ncbi:MAG: type II restriction endonuclease [Ruminococcus sp.]|nr:type II restriction endonuclease [Ruminococcus sp.]
MENIAAAAINSVLSADKSFCKFLSANDTGLTGGHQAGIYISKPAVPILFDKPGTKDENKDRWVTILWHDGKKTVSRFIYYGVGTRNEYRITNFGRGFEYLQPEYTGALFVFTEYDTENYNGFILNSDDEINQFLDTFSLSPADTNKMINSNLILPDKHEKIEFDNFINTLTADFPSSEEMSKAARDIQNTVYNHNDYIFKNPDKKLIDWTETEYRLFRALEYARYGKIIENGFSSVEEFISTANIVLNRRKSRAGKSLEHHLAAIFEGNNLRFSSQTVTEGNKKPDFIFPSGAVYHNPEYPTSKIITLAAKTTCKDRWRQIINEADRLRGKDKFLCTLQQGISSSQMDEMSSEKVILVVPKPYISSYPKEKQSQIWTLEKFISYVKEIEKPD